jgi:hypothetical protein
MNLRAAFPLLVAWALSSVGCAGAAAEPEAAFAELPPLAYPADVAFECLVEAVQAEGFSIEVSEREPTRADFATAFKPTRVDSFTDVEEAQRIRVQLEEVGADRQRVRMAASIFERPPHEDWQYLKRDPALQRRVEANLHQALERRYQ